MIKTYRLIRDAEHKGLMKTSVVCDPAIESTGFFFNDEKPDFVFFNEEKRLFYAPALIPNKLIFRKNINGEPANVYFDAETIRELHIEGMRNGYDNKVNLNHDQDNDTEGVFCFEQWIIEDTVNDKSIKLGFELPIGTLMKGYKIDNDQVWNDIKEGKLKGLSIEGQLFPEEQKNVNLKKEDMNKKGAFALAIEKLKEIFESEEDKEKDLPIEEEVKDKELDEEVVVDEEPKEEESDLQAELTAALTRIADLEAELAKVNEMQMSNEASDLKLKEDFEALKLSKETLDAETLKLQSELMEFKKIPMIPADDKPATALEKYRQKKEALK